VRAAGPASSMMLCSSVTGRPRYMTERCPGTGKAI
jgi:hypothetical protein